MTKERKRQLAFILADIVGCNEQKAEEIIDTTELGKRLQYHDTTILYEQQTENMYRLAEELREGPYANFAVCWNQSVSPRCRRLPTRWGSAGVRFINIKMTFFPFMTMPRERP